MRGRRLLLLAVGFTGMAGLALVVRSIPAFAADELPGRQVPNNADTIDELRKQVEEQERQLRGLADELQWLRVAATRVAPDFQLSGEWTLEDASQAGKPAKAPVKGLRFEGQRVRFSYTDARGEREYTFRADHGSPLPTIDLYEPGGTVNLGIFAFRDPKVVRYPVNVIVSKEVPVEERVDGKPRTVTKTVYETVTQEVQASVAQELRLAFDRGTGLRPADLSEKGNAVVWRFRRQGGFRPPPTAPESPFPEVPPQVMPVPVPMVPPGKPVPGDT